MGLNIPSRVAAPAKRVASAASLGIALLMLGACSGEQEQQLKNLAMPDPVTDTGSHTFDLWSGRGSPRWSPASSSGA